MRRCRVLSCLASSTQQMNSLRASGVMSFQAASAAQRLVQVRGQLVHHPTGNVLAGHTPTVASGW